MRYYYYEFRKSLKYVQWQAIFISTVGCYCNEFLSSNYSATPPFNIRNNVLICYLWLFTSIFCSTIMAKMGSISHGLISVGPTNNMVTKSKAYGARTVTPYLSSIIYTHIYILFRIPKKYNLKIKLYLY